MDLSHWLVARKLTDAAFAAMVGCNQTTINRARRGVTMPEPILLMKIVSATDGEVAAADIIATFIAANQSKVAASADEQAA